MNVSFPELLRENASQLRGPLIATDLGTIAQRLLIAATEIECADDAAAIRDFADVMTTRMERKTMEGRTGWTRIPVAHLWAMLREQVAQGEPADIAIVAMMIHHNREEGTEHRANRHDADPVFTERSRDFLLRPILERLTQMSTTISDQQTANTTKLVTDLGIIKTGIADLKAQLASVTPPVAGAVVTQEQEDAFAAAVTTADTMAAAFAPPPSDTPPADAAAAGPLS